MRLLSLAIILSLAPVMVFAQRGGGHGGGGGGGVRGGGSMGGVRGAGSMGGMGGGMRSAPSSSRGFSGGAMGGSINGGAYRGGVVGGVNHGYYGGYHAGYGGYYGGRYCGYGFGFGFGFDTRTGVMAGAIHITDTERAIMAPMIQPTMATDIPLAHIPAPERILPMRTMAATTTITVRRPRLTPRRCLLQAVARRIRITGVRITT